MPIASKNINAEKIQGNLDISSVSASAFTGSFIGDGAGLYNLPTQSFDTGSLVTTASFNAFTASYATGSFTGSFTGSLQGTASYALTASYLDTYIPPFPYTGSAEITGSLTVTGSTNLYNPGATVLSVAGAQGEIFSVTDDTSGDLLVVQSGSTDILVVSASGQTTLSGSLTVTTGVTASLYGTASWAENAVTASYVLNAVSSSFALTSSFITASDVYGPYGSNSVISASYALQALSSSYANFATSASHTLFAETASNSLNAQDILIYVLNNSGYNIPKGTVVHITASGNSSDTPRIISASYENDANSANTLGIANESIANGANGYVMTEGVLRGIDTSNFISGQLIYLGATGSIIGSAPQAPLHGVRLGQVVRQQSNNGSIYVRIDNGYELDELHDVRIITASLQYGDLLMRSGSVWTNSKQLSGSYNMAGTLSATHVTASDLYAGNTYISGSLTVLGGATIFGSSSFVYITASQIDVSASFISVNVFEPIQRFGGLKVYDSGSSSATASLAWDSLHNHWVYENVSGSSYAGGMLLSGPRNTGSLGDEPELAQWFVPRGDGGDHLENSQIYSSGSIHQVTGSLTVTGGITGSLSGTASFATTASFASTSSVAQRVAVPLGSGHIGQIQANGTALDLNNSSTGVQIRLNSTNTTQFFQVGTFSNGVNITPGANSPTSGLTVTTGSYPSATLLRVGVNDLVVTGSRIGIGTTTPVDAVEIVGYSKYIKIAGTSETDRSAWIGNGADGTGNVYLFNGTNTNSVFITGNGSSFFNGGNVGIGLFQPSISASLHISGTNASTLLRLDAPGSSSILHVTGSGRVGIGTSTPATALDVNGTIRVDNTSFTGNALTIAKTANNTTRITAGPGGTEYIQFGASNSITLNASSVITSALLTVGTRIQAAIGDSTGLEINNTQLLAANQTRTGITLQTAAWGNVGAGGASTLNAVKITPTINHTLGTVTGTVLLLDPIINTTGGTHTIRGLYYNPTLTSTTGTTHRAIETTTGDVIFGSTSGNVGIGKTTPNARLDVSGSAIITGSLTVTQGITGSLFGTASFATTASYAEFAQTASYIDGGFY